MTSAKARKIASTSRASSRRSVATPPASAVAFHPSARLP
jgi:hypothetical protein